MPKIKVLFVCIHNSARSQMAEAFLNYYSGDEFEAESAGLEPGKLNNVVVDVMDEIGIDISENQTKSVFDFFKQGKYFHYVITVCDETTAERCPVFPYMIKKIHWSFTDPSTLTGDFKERLEETRKIRDQIKEQIKNWVNELKVKSDSNNLLT